MKKWMNKIGWILSTVLGAAIFALGFDLFLLPHGLNCGGVSGLSMVLVELLGSFLTAIGLYNFAVPAAFPMTGFSGLAGNGGGNNGGAIFISNIILYYKYRSDTTLF